MDKELKLRLLSKDKWLRLFFMVIFACVNYVVQVIIWVLAAIQFLISLFTDNINQNLTRFGGDLSRFSLHIMQFLTYNTEEKPYPFTDWPGKPE